MNEHVVDTHALYWYLANSPRLGAKASQIMDEAAIGNGMLIVPSIVIAELYYLNLKLGKPLDFTGTLNALLQGQQYEFADLQAKDMLLFDSLAAISEMHDRIVVAVARSRNAQCLTCDRQIVSSNLVATVW